MLQNLVIQSDVIRVIKGEDLVFHIYLYDEAGRPFDLAPYNAFEVALPGSTATVSITQTASSGSVVAKQSPDELGALTVTIKADKTALLKASDRLQDVDLELNNTGTPAPRRQRFSGVLLVRDSLL
jgi:hypothetical protein